MIDASLNEKQPVTGKKKRISTRTSEILAELQIFIRNEFFGVCGLFKSELAEIKRSSIKT